MLYTNEFVASLPKPVPFKNPWVVGFCNFDSHAKTRELIEKWYKELPEDIKSRFKSRLLSTDDEVFIPAFHELSICRYCQEEGWDIEYEPELSNGLTPDLIVDTKQWGKVAIEVTTVFDAEAIKYGERRRDMLTQKVALIDTDKVLEIAHHGHPQADYKPAQAAAKVKSWLDTIQDEKTHKKTFEAYGCHFTVTVDKNVQTFKPTQGCIYAELNDVADVPDYSEKIKKKLNQKRTKYSSKSIDMPLVIVLADGVGLVRMDEHAVDKALFGKFTFTWYTNGDKPGQVGRDRSGHFTPSNDSKGNWFGKNTGISSVMFSSYKGSGQFHMQLFNNPVAQQPLPFESFKIIPQLVVAEEKPNITLRWALNEPDNFLDKPEDCRVVFN